MNNFKTIVHLGGRPISISFSGFDDEVEIDQLLTIDHSNLYGEAVTVPALMNQIGLMKAEQEKIYAEKKLELEVFESELRQRLRKEAVTTSQKITENGLNEMVSIDRGYQTKKKNVITAQHNFEVIESVWWAVKSKDTKLNNLIKGVTPEELYNELIDGIVNNILIKKHRSITER